MFVRLYSEVFCAPSSSGDGSAEGESVFTQWEGKSLRGETSPPRGSDPAFWPAPGSELISRVTPASDPRSGVGGISLCDRTELQVKRGTPTIFLL